MDDTNSSSGSWTRWSRFVAAAAALAAAGCAAMTEPECRGANWYSLGERDGLMGLQPRWDQYAWQCRAVKVDAEDRNYMAGWQIGKWEYDKRVHSSDCCGPN